MGTWGGCDGGNDRVGVDGRVLAVVVPPPPGNATLPDARTLTAVDLAANNPALLLAIRRSPQQQSTKRLQGEDANIIIVKGGLVKCKCESSHEQQSFNAPTTADPAPNNQLTSKQVYTQKPPHQSKKGIGHKKKNSTYNYGAARNTLGLPNNAHHYQVYAAAVASNSIIVNETPLVISPTKEEVKAERNMLHSIATDLECKFESSKKKLYPCNQSQGHLLILLRLKSQNQDMRWNNY
jgi:hypothetical protein